MALGKARLRPIAIVGEGVATVSTVASVVRAEGVWRPMGFWGIRNTCGIHGPLVIGRAGVNEMRWRGWMTREGTHLHHFDVKPIRRILRCKCSLRFVHLWCAGREIRTENR